MNRDFLEQIDDWWSALGVSSDGQLNYADLATVLAARAVSESPIEVKSAPVRSDAQKTPVRPQASSFTELVSEIEAFDGCELKSVSQNTVVFDGTPESDVMIIGEAPGADEDREGKPFVGQAGKLLDNMLASIGLSRQENCLITNMIYWRPPRNRNPSPEELALCRPYVERMVEIIGPKVILTFGAVPSKAILRTEKGINQLRGRKHTLTIKEKSIVVIPNFHPAYLLRRPHDKARAWRDLLVAKPETNK